MSCHNYRKWPEQSKATLILIGSYLCSVGGLMLRWCHHFHYFAFLSYGIGKRFHVAMQNMVRTSVTLGFTPFTTFFVPTQFQHCDLLLIRHPASWSLFVKLIEVWNILFSMHRSTSACGVCHQEYIFQLLCISWWNRLNAMHITHKKDFEQSTLV